jgi:hypothetical protein
MSAACGSTPHGKPEHFEMKINIEWDCYGFCTSIGAWRLGINAVACTCGDGSENGWKYVVSYAGTSAEYDLETLKHRIAPQLKDFASVLAPKLAAC